MSTPAGYTDGIFFCTDLSALARAVAGLPVDMLGDDQVVSVDGASVTVRARRGWSACAIVDPENGQSMTVPGAGDPALWYVAVRVEGALPFDPAACGLSECDAATSAAVLGVWA